MGQSRSYGFTLIELALALVIIGMIVGGVIVGESMIRASAMRSVISDTEHYTSAVALFQKTYQALPGDYANATTQWGGTCNGDGDGNIGDPSNANATTNSELFCAWWQLAQAGFTDGRYTGVAGTDGVGQLLPGVNVPKSQVTAAGWRLGSIDYAGAYGVPYVAGDIQYGVTLWLGGKGTSSFANVPAPVMKPEEAFELDTKMDDGLGSSGKLTGWYPAPLQVKCVDPGTGKYSTTTDDITCTVLYKTGM